MRTGPYQQHALVASVPRQHKTVAARLCVARRADAPRSDVPQPNNVKVHLPHQSRVQEDRVQLALKVGHKLFSLTMSGAARAVAAVEVREQVCVIAWCEARRAPRRKEKKKNKKRFFCFFFSARAAACARGGEPATCWCDAPTSGACGRATGHSPPRRCAPITTKTNSFEQKVDFLFFFSCRAGERRCW